MTELVHDQPRRNWLRARQSGVFSTDAAAIAGVGFVDAAEVYREKVALEPIEREPNLRMRLGTELESFVVREYEAATGAVAFVNPPFMAVRHPEQPWRGTTPDAIVERGNGAQLLECKCVFGAPGSEWGEPGTDEIPDGYLIQVQHALDVCYAAEAIHTAIADVAVLFVGYELRVYRVEHNPALLESLVALEAEFWRRVQDRDEVGSEWVHPLRDELSNRLARLRPGTSIELPDDALATVAEFEHEKELSKQHAELADCKKRELITMLSGAESGLLPDGRTLRQKVVHRKSYTVDACDYVDFRILKSRKGKVSSGR